MTKRINKELAIKLRSEGLTYKQIAEKLSCSVEWCKRHLVGVKKRNLNYLQNREKYRTQKKRRKEGSRYKIDGNYIYYVVCNEQVIYIGRGSGYRFEHTDSGVSHKYHLNLLHFAGVPVQTHIIYSGLSNKEAKDLEVEMIMRVQPVLNSDHTNIEFALREDAIRQLTTNIDFKLATENVSYEVLPMDVYLDDIYMEKINEYI